MTCPVHVWCRRLKYRKAVTTNKEKNHAEAIFDRGTGARPDRVHPVVGFCLSRHFGSFRELGRQFIWDLDFG
jgi:hypothetical protein